MIVGEIYRCDRFYCDPATGEFLAKYLVILALPEGGDVVARLVTSQHGDVRPKDPPCFHGVPYPGYFLGGLPPPLIKDSWLDLRRLDDFDRRDFESDVGSGRITLVDRLSGDVIRGALDCASRADDTTRQQTRHMLRELDKLR